MLNCRDPPTDWPRSDRRRKDKHRNETERFLKQLEHEGVDEDGKPLGPGDGAQDLSPHGEASSSEQGPHTPSSAAATPGPTVKAEIEENADVAGRIDTLRSIATTMIRSFSFNEELTFMQSPDTQPTFRAEDVTTMTKGNKGRHALNPSVPANLPLLRHEKELLSLREEVAALQSRAVGDNDRSCVQLMVEINTELERIQFRKQAEWLRQRSPHTQGMNPTGAPLVDTCESSASVHLVLLRAHCSHQLVISSLRITLFIR